MNGWIKMHRAAFDHDMFAGRPDWLGAWVMLLMKADHETGQLRASLVTLQTWFNWTPKQARYFLKKLEQEGMIDRASNEAKKGTKGALITICNYSKYQNNQNEQGTQRAPIGATKGHIVKKEEEEERKKHTRVRAPAQSQKQAVDDMRAALTGEVDPVVWTDDHRLKIVCPIEYAEQLKRFGGDESRLNLALEQAAGWIQPHNRSKPLIAQVRAQLAQQAARIADSDRRYKQAKAASAPLGTSNTATDADRAFLASCAKNLPTVKAVPVQEDWGID